MSLVNDIPLANLSGNKTRFLLYIILMFVNNLLEFINLVFMTYK